MSRIETSGRAFCYGDDVNTDVIFPGKYTYTLREPEQIKAVALEDLDPAFSGSVRPGDVIVAGRNFGCGSSREQAVSCLVLHGVGAVIAASFSRIFFRNAINNGLVAIVCPEVVGRVSSGDEVGFGLDRCLVSHAGREFPFLPYAPQVRAILEAGGLVEATRRRLQDARGEEAS